LKQLVQSGVEVWFYLDDRQRTLDGPMEKMMLAFQAAADPRCHPRGGGGDYKRRG
jgi:hypothetical protein